MNQMKKQTLPKNLFQKLTPKDLVAIIVLIACFILLYNGVDSFVTAITTAIIGYYFSKRVYEEKK